MNEGWLPDFAVEARRIVADALAGSGKEADAAIVRSGRGDDFPEIQGARAALAVAAKRLGLLESALSSYADEAFWEGEVAEAALAFHDGGEIARAALAGRDPSAHRD